MAILKISVLDGAGQAMPGQLVKVTGCDSLQTNGQGLSQFLLDDGRVLEIEIGGVPVWTGNASELARDERFQQSGAGFSRLAA